MPYREVTMHEVKEVLRLWLMGHGKKPIARQLGLDRNTVRSYIAHAERSGLDRAGGEASLTDELILVAVLAVNSFTLEKVWKLLPGLREQGLTNPATVTGLEIGALTVRLALSGYDRGLLTEKIALRVQELMKAVLEGHLDAIPTALLVKDAKKIVETLESVRGIGPKVARNALALLLS